MDSAATVPKADTMTDVDLPHSTSWVEVAAAGGAVVPMVAIGVWMYVIRGRAPTLEEMLAGPLLCGGAMIFWILFLHLFACRERLWTLGFRGDRPRFDVLMGVAIGIGLLGFQLVFGATIGRLLPPRPPVPEILQLIDGLSRNPWLLALWLGPVVWIGVALFEELWRVFVLRRLWNAWPSTAGRWAVIVAVSALVAVGHGYQGAAAVVSIGLMSVFKGWFFMRTDRLWPLVIGHALYDSIQIVMAVVAIRRMGL
jgi:membrane protease YdiL (CAAX protease family)